VAFTSPNAVTRFMAVLGTGEVPAAVRWAVVGSGTARALREGGIEPDLVPGVSVSEALAEEFPAVDPLAPGDSDQRSGGIGTVLFPRAETVRGALAMGLRAKGWLVDEVVAYRTVGADPGPDAVALARRSDAIVFTSSSTVDRTIEVLGPDGLPPMIVTIGPVTSRSARAADLVVAGEASPHTIDGLVDALVATVARGEGAGRPQSGQQDLRSERQTEQQAQQQQ
jgi:uroporphyrinogen-III synthase